MSKTLQEATDHDAHVAQVVHHGEKLTLPEGMNIDDAIGLLERRRDFLSEEVAVQRKFDVFPWDGASALQHVLEDVFGWAQGVATPGLFGSKPPKMISVEVNPGEYTKVPWGRFSLPGVDGFMQCDAKHSEGRLVFALVAKVERKDEPMIERIYSKVEEYLKHNSIYRGKAIKLRFRDEDGDTLPMPEPKFIDTTKANRGDLVFSRDVKDAVETNLFTPIERVQDCVANDIPVKRGILLGGPYGTGKTMAASVAAAIAVENGITYLCVPRADELADAIDFAKQYQQGACVVFCEDIDRVMSGERSVEMDDILNILDGIDSKDLNIITVLTTNHLENINPAMLRPGRLDAIISVNPPDQNAVEKLLRLYGGDAIAEDANLLPAAELLDGTIPAVIAEVIKRAKLVQMKLQEPGTKVREISGDAILEAAETMRGQIDLLEAQSKPKDGDVHPLETALGNVVKGALNGSGNYLERTHKKVSDLHDVVC